MTNLANVRLTTLSVTGLVVLCGVAVAGCGSDDRSPAKGSGVSGDVVVFAASSLTEAFTEIGDAFEEAHPDVHVTFNFAGSGELVTQITEGAPADVFASADEANMAKLTDAEAAAGAPRTVARNTFEIIVEPGNPMAITGVADLADPDLIVVLCADTVPCGKGAAAIIADAGVTVTPKSFEDKVKGVVTKVTAGEADAGIVFVTDVKAAGGDATGVEIPAELNVVNDYPVVVTKESANPVAAQAFVDFVAGDEGQEILAAQGFLAP